MVASKTPRGFRQKYALKIERVPLLIILVKSQEVATRNLKIKNIYLFIASWKNTKF